MKNQYMYTGPLSGVSLKGIGDVMLIPGAVVALPAGHYYTERLIRKGWLSEVKAEKKKLKNNKEN
jgi:hypothetical protein